MLVGLLLTAAFESSHGRSCTTIAVGPGVLKEGGTAVTHTADCMECDWRLAFVPKAADDADVVIRKYRPRYPTEVSERSTTWSASNLEYATLDVDAMEPPFVNEALASSQRAAWASEAWDEFTTCDVVTFEEASALGEGDFGSFEALFGIANSAGLGIGESTTEAVFPGLEPRDSPDAEGPGVDVSQLTRVAVRFCATARCAIRVIGTLGERHGYYAAETVPRERGEALTIADGTEAWMFHILPDATGLSAIWAAQRVPRGHVAVSANAFVIRGLPPRAYDENAVRECLFDLASDCDVVASSNVLS